jgi:hypothetical protein
MSMPAALLNAGCMAAQLPGYWLFRRALANPRPVQEGLLDRYLRANAHTEFGRRHGFGRIRSAREYQARVPLSVYDDYEEAVWRIRQGAGNVLTRSRVRCLEPSSGSTRAAKLIPYTAEMQAEIDRAVSPWLVDLALSRPGVLGGPAYWSITPAVAPPAVARDQAEGEVPVGFESDSAYLGGSLRWLMERILVPCSDLRFAGDHREFRRRTLLRLLALPGLRLISVWHPTFLTLLLDELVTSWEDLLRHLHQGVEAAGNLRAIPADPRRARALASADPLVPASVWPWINAVSCWGDGQAAALLPGLQARLPDVHFQPKGLIATEAFVSLPFAGLRPLAVRSHFFEFIDRNGNARLAWELVPEEIYSVVVTTGGGLYRYQLRDQVAVEGSVGRTPCLRFLGKEDGISDLRGEKLSEGFVAAVLGRLLPRLAPRTEFALLAPETSGDVPRYVLYMVTAGPPCPELAAALESELGANPNYTLCVRLGQLLPSSVEHVPPGAPARFMSRMVEAGQRLGSIKPVALSQLTDWGAYFHGRAL